MGRIHANGAHKIYMRDTAYLIYTLTCVAVVVVVVVLVHSHGIKNADLG